VLLLLLVVPATTAAEGDHHGRAARARRDPAAPAGEAAPADLPSEASFTACHRYPDGKRFRLSLHGEVTVAELVAVVGDIGCQTIVVGPAVAQRAGKVALEVPDLVTAPEVYRIFHASLEAMGFTLQRSGGLWKVVDAARAQEVSRFVGGGPTPAGEEYVTRLLRVERAAVGEIAEVLGKLRSHDGAVLPYPAGQSLVVTDHADNVRRMQDVARALDVAQPGEHIFSVAAHAQSPSELAATLDKVLSATRRAPAGAAAAGAADRSPAAPGAAALVPVDAARLLLVVGDEAAYRKVAAICARIDPPLPEGGAGQTHVLYLSYTNAEEIAATLATLGLSARGAPQSTPAKAGAAPTASPLTGEVRLAADKVSNAIVVFGSGPDYLMIRDLVARLDLPRRQVYVEAAILDVTVDKNRQLGLSAHGADTSSSATVVGASGSSSLTSIATSAASLASMFTSGGLTTGVFGNSFTWNGITVPSFGVVLKAIESSKDVNVISRPHLLTMDNVKASISVGQSIPFQTQSLGALASGTTSPSLLSSYQRQDVALKLELTPHLNDSDSIRLELDGEISDVPDGQSASAAGGPTTNKRTVKTQVVVGDGETVVLGGLQKDSESQSIERVPGLGEIPILGRLFSYRSRQRTRQDLLIAITPYVIRGPADLRRIFERKQQDQREFSERFDAHPGFDAPIDWGRRRGLLEEINAVARQAEHEGQLLREASRGRRPPPLEGSVDLEGGARSGEGD